MSDKGYPWKSGDNIRNKPGQVWHKAWGSHTVCGRRIELEAEIWPKDEPRGDRKAGAVCQLCTKTPLITFTFASGRRVSRYIQ